MFGMIDMKIMYADLKDYILSLDPAGFAGASSCIASCLVWGLVLSVVLVVARWHMFRRTGTPGWHSIVPVLGRWDLYRFAWGKAPAFVSLGLNLVCLLALPAGIALDIAPAAYVMAGAGVVLAGMELMCMWKLCRAFGRGFWFFLGLLVFPAVFRCVLGFGEMRYVPPKGKEKKGRKGAKT